MGLDMYLSRKTYVKNWSHMGPKERTQITIKRGGQPFPDIDTDKISYITEEVGCWRKANAVHAWFIENCAEGDGNRTEMYVEEGKLKKLYEICKKIKAEVIMGEDDIKNGYTFKDGKRVPILEKGMTIVNPEISKELLPTQSGFFFGSTDYDQWYMNDIDLTIEILKPLIDVGGPYYYTASW